MGCGDDSTHRALWVSAGDKLLRETNLQPPCTRCTNRNRRVRAEAGTFKEELKHFFALTGNGYTPHRDRSATATGNRGERIGREWLGLKPGFSLCCLTGRYPV